MEETGCLLAAVPGDGMFADDYQVFVPEGPVWVLACDAGGGRKSKWMFFFSFFFTPLPSLKFITSRVFLNRYLFAL